MRPEAKIFAHWVEEQQLHTLLENDINSSGNG